MAEEVNIDEISTVARAAIALDLLMLIDEAIDRLRPSTVEELRAMLSGMKLGAEDLLRNG